MSTRDTKLCGYWNTVCGGEWYMVWTIIEKFNLYLPYAGVMGCGAAEATGMCFVVIPPPQVYVGNLVSQ